MGELIAWIIGWDLVLEYTVAATTVSISWSRYLVVFLEGSESTCRPLLPPVPGMEDCQYPSIPDRCPDEPLSDPRDGRKFYL